ncbi:MAG: hypothetical protein AVDCRST_MAG10-2403, partial [uncultured Acidimicrobiales bacterium]
EHGLAAPGGHPVRQLSSHPPLARRRHRRSGPRSPLRLRRTVLARHPGPLDHVVDPLPGRPARRLARGLRPRPGLHRPGPRPGVTGWPPQPVHAGPLPLLPVRRGRGPARRRPGRPAQAATAHPSSDPAPLAGAGRRPSGLAGGRAPDARPRAATAPEPAPGPQPAGARRGRGRHRAAAGPMEVPSLSVPGGDGLGLRAAQPGRALRRRSRRL